MTSYMKELPKKIKIAQAGNLAVLVKTAGESMGLREAMYVFFPGFIAVSKKTSSLLVTNHPLYCPKNYLPKG